jgi:hypothetical protein
MQGSTKSFPDYKHLLQEIYVEYKHIFLPLLKLVKKKLLELSYILKKKYVCIPRSFLVINICNQGKTLCSPCTLFPSNCWPCHLWGSHSDVLEVSAVVRYDAVSLGSRFRTFRKYISKRRQPITQCRSVLSEKNGISNYSLVPRRCVAGGIKRFVKCTKNGTHESVRFGDF